MLLKPTTSAGALLGDTWPLPSWPTSLAPQHQTWPSPASAQLWSPPLAIAIAVGGPTTRLGGSEVISSPPSCCRSARPQQKIRPSPASAQACDAPAAIAVARTDSLCERATGAGAPRLA